MTKKPELGIKDPYELNEAQYTAALELLRKQHPLVQRYWHDANVQVQDFTSEGIVASSTWPFQVNTLTSGEKPQPIASTVPAEGATGWADTTMLHANAKHPNCAYKWLDWQLTPKVQGDVAAWFGSGRRCRLRARTMRCSAPRAARPTASTTSTGFTSGARRSPPAPRRERAFPTAGGQRTTLPSWAAADRRLAPAVEFREVARTFDTVRAVDRVSLSVEPGEFFAMLGPSGSGKTTCLRLIAGFDLPDAGQVLLEGRDVSSVPPYERNVNTVFQDYALFPHMTVLENAYGPRMRKVSASERSARAHEMLSW
jgi:ABC-type multidrug transport system fused ATPase/permease subunit